MDGVVLSVAVGFSPTLLLIIIIIIIIIAFLFHFHEALWSHKNSAYTTRGWNMVVLSGEEIIDFCFKAPDIITADVCHLQSSSSFRKTLKTDLFKYA